MGGTAFTISRAAALAGTDVKTVEDFLHTFPTAAVKAQGQRVVTEAGLTLLRSFVQGIKGERAGASGEPAERSTVVRGVGDPLTWSSEEVDTRGHELAEKLRAEGVTTDQGGQPLIAGGIRIPEGR